MGVIRVSEENRRSSENRDRKTSLNKDGRKRISWIHKDRPLPPQCSVEAPRGHCSENNVRQKRSAESQ
ncbi:NaeI family type II restriction endonuclease [Leucobacter sp. OH1287]|uniref:NaeI family type II restriction endonuclease n=1 Tax=Leucobacter sp. OH1287 TaxID=2491049 RepID=UPI0035140518